MGWSRVEENEFARVFSIARVALPGNLCRIGHTTETGWLVSGSERAILTERVAPLLAFWERRLRRHALQQRFWLVCCLWDGWRERVPYAPEYRFEDAAGQGGGEEWAGPPGVVPLFHADHPRIACFGAHRGDPSALLLPEPHYLAGFYRRLRLRVRIARRPWRMKAERGVFCGSDHGQVINQFPPIDPLRPFARRRLSEVVAAERLPVDVHLGSGVGLARQISYRYILDVDGHVRTWDAWAWKLLSGSLVLSQESIWETFFTRQFEPWQHFVPVANDFSDLAEKLAWCRSHDERCREIVARARVRAEEVYDPSAVAAQMGRALAAALPDATAPSTSPA